MTKILCLVSFILTILVLLSLVILAGLSQASADPLSSSYLLFLLGLVRHFLNTR